MSGSKWTPGPWEVRENAQIAVRRTEQRRHVTRVRFVYIANATIPQDYSIPRSADEVIGERDANARLIALAPELAECLAETVPFLIRLGDFIGNGEGPTKNERCDVILKARSLLSRLSPKAVRP